jgi:glutamine amidotransferase
MSLVAVVDYGMGNLRSVSRALEHVALPGQRVSVTSDPDEIEAADHVVFPGQGAARDCMLELRQRELIDCVLKAAKEKPFLGICMGLQVLMSHSEENNGIECMGQYKGDVRFFGGRLTAEGSSMEPGEDRLKIPHMGWNNVQHTNSHPMWNNIKQNSRFYFVHSYYVDPEDTAIVAGETVYGIKFTSAVARDNVFAVQFHPEKSAADGLQLLENFLGWNGQFDE